MLIVGNWKAYVEDFEKAKSLFSVSKKASRGKACTVVLAPSAPFLSGLALRNTSNVSFAIQDISATSGGAMTGEVTASMAATCGASYAIIGHSERRSMGDTNTIIAEKITHALARNLIPILCVGEQERDGEGRYLSFVREEITTALTTLTPRDRAEVIIAYEPLWAIGQNATHAIDPNDLVEMVLYIRKVLSELLPGKNSSQTLVLYGGSVEPENVRDLAIASNVDGFLIGRASVDETIFQKLIQQLT